MSGSSEDEREKFVILLLGSSPDPLPSFWHLQKEVFIIAQTYPKTETLFKFDKGYEGPYCQALEDTAQEPIYHEDAMQISNGRILLTDKGKKMYRVFANELASNPKFLPLLSSMKMVRAIYDKLTIDELLFLIYSTYPKYAVFSNYSDRLLKNQQGRKSICESLLKKELITEQRYTELLRDSP